MRQSSFLFFLMSNQKIALGRLTEGMPPMYKRGKNKNKNIMPQALLHNLSVSVIVGVSSIGPHS